MIMGFKNTIINDKDPSYIHSLQVLDRIKEMHNAKSEEDWKKYWQNFHSVGVIMSGHLSNEIKKILQTDYDRLELAIKEIKKRETNEKVRDSLITELRKEFALSHEILLVSCLSNLDIIKKTDDGEIFIEDYELDEMENMIRKSTSNADVNRKIEAKEDVDGEE